jgi:hypothetical protein
LAAHPGTLSCVGGRLAGSQRLKSNGKRPKNQIRRAAAKFYTSESAEL